MKVSVNWRQNENEVLASLSLGLPFDYDRGHCQFCDYAIVIC